jgi:hypothetical protein
LSGFASPLVASTLPNICIFDPGLAIVDDSPLRRLLSNTAFSYVSSGMARDLAPFALVRSVVPAPASRRLISRPSPSSSSSRLIDALDARHVDRCVLPRHRRAVRIARASTRRAFPIGTSRCVDVRVDVVARSVAPTHRARASARASTLASIIDALAPRAWAIARANARACADTMIGMRRLQRWTPGSRRKTRTERRRVEPNARAGSTS